MYSKHKGSIINSGTRCVVVFRELPKDEKNCLVVMTDSLPEIYRDAFDSVVTGEGQNTVDLYEVLNRNIMPTGENMLSALHRYGYLVVKKTTEVIMHLDSLVTINLQDLNDQIRKSNQSRAIVEKSDIQSKLNPFDSIDGQISLDGDETKGIAEKVLKEANDLKTKSEMYFERAYKLDPSLKPAEIENSDIDNSVVITKGVPLKDLTQELKAKWKKINE